MSLRPGSQLSEPRGGTDLADLVEERVIIPPHETVSPILGLQWRYLHKGALVHLQHHRRMLLLGYLPLFRNP